MKILDHIEGFDQFWSELLFNDAYIKRDQVRVHIYSGGFYLQDLTAAMKSGKTCTWFKVSWYSAHGHDCRWLDQCVRRHGYNFRSMFNELLALPWTRSERWPNVWQSIPLPDDSIPSGVTLEREERRSTRTFSPWGELNPLTALPAKWTIPHVLRCLYNGQFERLMCDGIYTDDYAHDDAVNYHKGDFSDHALDFVKRIYESPSGWHTHAHEGRVSISCHHFDNNSFTPKLTMRFNRSPDPQTEGGGVTAASRTTTKKKARARTVDSPLAGKVRAISPLILHTMIATRTVLEPGEVHARFVTFCQDRNDADWRNAWTSFTATLALKPLPSAGAPTVPHPSTWTRNTILPNVPSDSPEPVIAPAPSEPVTEKADECEVAPLTPAANIVPISFTEPSPETQSTIPVPITFTPPASSLDRWRQRLALRTIS